MKVNSPLHSVDARGAFGPGVVFAKAKVTNWARVRLRTPQPFTEKQQKAKENLIKRVRGFGAITEGEREDWRDWALLHPRVDSMGQTYYPTGSNYFSGFGVICLNIPKAPVDTAPGAPDPGPFTLWTWTWFPLLYSLRVDWTITGVADFVNVWWTGKLGAGEQSSDPLFRWGWAINEGVGVFYAGPFEPGERYGIRGRYLLNSGQFGVWDSRVFNCPV